MGRTACTEPQCLYKGALYLTYDYFSFNNSRPFRIVVKTPYLHLLDHVFYSNAKEKCLLQYFSVCAVRYCNRV
jgi:hypothetical protein